MTLTSRYIGVMGAALKRAPAQSLGVLTSALGPKGSGIACALLAFGAAAFTVEPSAVHAQGKIHNGAEQPAAHTAETRKVFVFYDPSIAGLGDALKRRPGVTVIPLTSGEPFAQIADSLEGQTGVSAIHVITHGEEGGMKIDGNLYSSTQGDLSSFARIRHALAPGADILLYGCNIGKGFAGQAYLQLVAQLTGADLAASTDEVRISPNAAPPKFVARSGSIEAAPLHFGTWQGLLWTSETGEGGWYGDANVPSGSPALNPRAANITTVSLPGGVRFSTMGDVQTGGASTTFSIVAVSGMSAMRLVHSTTNPTTYAAAVSAGNYFKANLVVGGTTGAALSRMTYNQVSANTAGAQFQLALYDTVTTTLTPISSAFTVSGSAVTQSVPFTTPLTGMVPGRTYELRWYGLNCGAGRTCYIDNPAVYTQLNQAPTATNDAFSITAQAPVSGNIITANNGSGVDSDPESQTLTVDQINGATFTVGSNIALTNGTLVITNANGAFTFTPSAGFSGTQSFTYRVNDGFGLTSSATVTITVAASIVPAAETGTAVSGTASTPIANVRSNDTINGVAATSTNSTVAQSGTWPAGISLNTTTGAITTTAAVAPGTYNVAYQLCDRNTPANCATVTVTITVAASIVPAAETGTAVSGTASTPIANVRSNDTVNGAAATSANSTIAQSGIWPAGISLNTTTGAVTTTAVVAPGTYNIAYQLCDRNTPANCATVTDTITVSVPQADLAVTKTNAVTSVNAGSTTSYTVTVTNNGPSSVTGAILTDAVATGLTKTAIACSGTPGQCSVGTTPTIAQLEGGYALPGLASGQTYQITVTASVTATSGSVANGAAIAAPSGMVDPTTANNTVTDTDTVTPVAELVITKTNGVTTVVSGSTTTYTVTVTNSGPSSVTGALIQDVPVSGLTCLATNPVTITGSGVPAGSFTISNLTGTGIALGTLANGQTATLTYSCKVN